MLNFRALSKQAQQLQEKLGSIQEELSSRRVDASSGGGMVKVVCDGLQNVVEIKIDPSVVDPQDIEMLEDLIVATNPRPVESEETVVELLRTAL